MKTTNFKNLFLILVFGIAFSCSVLANAEVLKNWPEVYSIDPSWSVKMIVSPNEKGCYQTINEDMKLVIRDSHFDADKLCALGRYHHDCQIYLLNCYLTNKMADTKIDYAYTNKGEALKEKWGARIYLFNVTRDGKTSDWMKNNLNEAKGSPKPAEITAAWTFGNQWDPEAEFKALGGVAAYEQQNIFDPIQKPEVHHSFLK